MSDGTRRLVCIAIDPQFLVDLVKGPEGLPRTFAILHDAMPDDAEFDHIGELPNGHLAVFVRSASFADVPIHEMVPRREPVFGLVSASAGTDVAMQEAAIRAAFGAGPEVEYVRVVGDGPLALNDVDYAADVIGKVGA